MLFKSSFDREILINDESRLVLTTELSSVTLGPRLPPDVYKVKPPTLIMSILMGSLNCKLKRPESKSKSKESRDGGVLSAMTWLAPSGSGKPVKLLLAKSLKALAVILMNVSLIVLPRSGLSCIASVSSIDS